MKFLKKHNPKIPPFSSIKVEGLSNLLFVFKPKVGMDFLGFAFLKISWTFSLVSTCPLVPIKKNPPYMKQEG
jgi:hypothetical protein